MRAKLLVCLVLLVVGSVLLMLPATPPPPAQIAVAIDLTAPWDREAYVAALRKALAPAVGRATIRASVFDSAEEVLYEGPVTPETAGYIEARLRGITSSAWGTYTLDGLLPAARWAAKYPHGQVLLFTDGGVEDWVREQSSPIDENLRGLPITILGTRVRDEVVSDYARLAFGHPRVVPIEQLPRETAMTLVKLPPIPLPYGQWAGWLCLAAGVPLLCVTLLPDALRRLRGVPVTVRVRVEGAEDPLERAARTRRVLRLVGGRPPADIPARLPFVLLLRPLSAGHALVSYQGGGHLVVDGAPSRSKWTRLTDGSTLEPAPGCQLTVEFGTFASTPVGGR